MPLCKWRANAFVQMDIESKPNGEKTTINLRNPSQLVGQYIASK
jgi:hypothetical protein